MDTRCPVCKLGDGFHDRQVHAQRVEVPARLIITKES
jgi:hypothetical protein